MVKKLALFILIPVLLNTLGCITPMEMRKKQLQKKYLGKQIPLKHFTKIQLNKPCSLALKTFDLEYTIHSLGENQIRFTGTLLYNKARGHGPLNSASILLNVESLELQVLFTDDTGKINGVEYFYAKSGQHIYAPIPFNVTLPYKKEYKSFILDGFIRWREST